jgi:hypothetical protein
MTRWKMLPFWPRTFPSVLAIASRMPHQARQNCKQLLRRRTALRSSFPFAFRKIEGASQSAFDPRSRYFSQQSGGYASRARITEVTFTPNQGRRILHTWFGSSGGGLPRRPELTFGTPFSFGPVSCWPAKPLRETEPETSKPHPLDTGPLDTSALCLHPPSLCRI